ncbi:MAG: 3-keto-disaccharide hydrolase [Gemmatimonadaceae bacterium]
MIHRAATRAAIIGPLAFIFAGCTQMGNSMPAASSTASGATPLTAEQTAAGWRPLFDGTSLAAWRGYKEQGVPAGWHIVDGVLTKSGSVNDLVTRDQFGNFELAFDWKLAPGGNAGVFYRGTEEYDHIYWSAPEYQLLDDARHPDGKSRLTSAGSDYAVYPSPAGVVKPADQWNSSLLVVNGNHVQHWLNGQKLLEYELGSPDWEAKVKASKFAAYPNYGLASRGYIGIQGDHDGALSIRNVRIREIK